MKLCIQHTKSDRLIYDIKKYIPHPCKQANGKEIYLNNLPFLHRIKHFYKLFIYQLGCCTGLKFTLTAVSGSNQEHRTKTNHETKAELKKEVKLLPACWFQN